MLVNTNDAFTGLNAIDVSSLAVDEALTFTTFAYDAGTEANSEAAGTFLDQLIQAKGLMKSVMMLTMWLCTQVSLVNMMV